MLFAGRAPRGLLFQMQNIGQLPKFAHAHKAKFREFRPFPFAFSPSLFFRFFFLRPHSFFWFCFSFAGHLLGFISEGHVFGKTFRIVELHGRKCGWVVKQDFFLLVFRVNFTWFLPFSLPSLTAPWSFWCGLQDLFTMHKLDDKVVLDRQNWRRQSQAIERTWVRTGGWRFRCKWA